MSVGRSSMRTKRMSGGRGDDPTGSRRQPLAGRSAAERRRDAEGGGGRGGAGTPPPRGGRGGGRGGSPSAPGLLAALGAKGLPPEAVDWVIVTHVHLDHAGGAGE